MEQRRESSTVHLVYSMLLFMWKIVSVKRQLYENFEMCAVIDWYSRSRKRIELQMMNIENPEHILKWNKKKRII